MSEQEREALEREAATTLNTDTLPVGRYIPYSGGSMGWFENQGVLKSERRNNYQLHTAMESEYVRSVLFQRWGQVTDRRTAQRIARENAVNLMMSDESAPPSTFELETGEGVLTGVTKDISHYGMRMQFTKAVRLAKGDRVVARIKGRDSGEALLELPATVMWIQREVIVRPVWFVGIAFLQLTAETEHFIADLLAH